MTGRVILVKLHVTPLLGNFPWLPGTLSENQCSSFSMTYETLSDLDPHPLLQLCSHLPAKQADLHFLVLGVLALIHSTGSARRPLPLH